MPWAIPATLALLCSAVTFCLAGEVPKDLVHKDGMILFVQKMGRAVQLGRVCGLTESELSGTAALYRAHLALADAEQRSRTLPEQEKQAMATQTDIEAAFLAGVQTIVARGPIATAECERIKVLLHEKNPTLAAGAKQIADLAQRIK